MIIPSPEDILRRDLDHGRHAGTAPASSPASFKRLPRPLARQTLCECATIFLLRNIPVHQYRRFGYASLCLSNRARLLHAVPSTSTTSHLRAPHRKPFVRVDRHSVPIVNMTTSCITLIQFSPPAFFAIHRQQSPSKKPGDVRNDVKIRPRYQLLTVRSGDCLRSRLFYRLSFIRNDA